mgnify:CR=1 FL=1
MPSVPVPVAADATAADAAAALVLPCLLPASKVPGVTKPWCRRVEICRAAAAAVLASGARSATAAAAAAAAIVPGVLFGTAAKGHAGTAAAAPATSAGRGPATGGGVSPAGVLLLGSPAAAVAVSCFDCWSAVTCAGGLAAAGCSMEV